LQRPTLVIGTKSWSSWSLRPWLALRVAGIEVDEVVIPLRRDGTSEAVRARSPTAKVPVLEIAGVRIAESLAILEYAAELAPSLWPAERLARAQARSIAAEMHAGFAALRQHCPMDVNQRLPQPELPAPVDADIRRIRALWAECRERHGSAGPFLFGTFTAADAMYAPVVTRFVTYDLPRDPTAAAYIDTVMTMPEMRRWGVEAAAEEPLPR
jgi:glutathione S-transferase